MQCLPLHPRDIPLPTELRADLLARGVAPDGPDDADRELRARRLETALMSLFRDTRSEAAFEALYLRTRPGLLSWVLHLCAGRGAACDPLDLLQDTFVNVYRYAGSFRDTGGYTFRGWARTIAANVVRRALRRCAGPSLQDLPHGVQEPADESAGPEQVASLVEERARLSRSWGLFLLHYASAFAELSPRDREALTLVEVEGRTYEEAGRLLGVGRSNMKMIMFRSRKRIRAHMQRAMGIEQDEQPDVRAAG